MLTDATVPDWRERYRRECLADRQARALPVTPPLSGAFQVTGTTADGPEASVTHLLLRLLRR